MSRGKLEGIIGLTSFKHKTEAFRIPADRVLNGSVRKKKSSRRILFRIPFADMPSH